MFKPPCWEVGVVRSRGLLLLAGVILPGATGASHRAPAPPAPATPWEGTAVPAGISLHPEASREVQSQNHLAEPFSDA